ncbi:MAG: DUF433 domain-containing protein [Phycisphaeraceae bacterium]|nr:DUF433 domain-containing protein [Phycisphaeraceae bacterium]
MELVRSDPQILGGVPCFAGTRVPVAALFEHLRAGYTVEYFLSQFPTVTRQQAEGVLRSVESNPLPFLDQSDGDAAARRAAG